MSQIQLEMSKGTDVSNNTQQNSWVVVSRNAHMKSRKTAPIRNSSKSSTLSTSLPARPPTRSRNNINVVKNNRNKTDNRLSINTLQGRVEITKSMLIDEIERVTSVRPEAVKFYGNQKPDAPHRTWLAFFTKAPSPRFRIFDESGISYVFKNQKSIECCKRCNGHHSSKFCSRAPSYGNSGSTMHTQDTCMDATRCRNCGGPHRSDSRKCLARPTRHGAPTKEKLKIYRQAGDRDFQASARVRAAEEKAFKIEAIKQNLRSMGDIEATSERGEAVVVTILESPEPDEVRVNTPENVQQESVLITADSTMDL
ncbi:hypothetical protein EPUL_002935 [Erysiphe pulchra]|uniref:Uncharacterized protein n=1 Tax=Erysiphe pulchra TaxID=225359 RepID=A0A2S4PQX8_9PEZI|nr:hypothetical protein EPUL_002935 [Erysiphe pulchra]